MKKEMQQIIISGLGGQGVLFVTRLLSDAALRMGLSVLISETHGMAQRGGNVISHLKVFLKGGGVISPLIRPGHADVMLALHPEALHIHGYYLKAGGEIFCSMGEPSGKNLHVVDAAGIASKLNSTVSANMVLLGFAAASGKLFCGAAQLESVIANSGGKRREISLKAFKAGCEAASFRN